MSEERDCWRGELPNRYTARRLFGWSDKEYDQQYWQRLERNWRRWKRVEPAGRVKGRLTTVREVVEEEGGKIEEWDKKNEVGQAEETLDKFQNCRDDKS